MVVSMTVPVLSGIVLFKLTLIEKGLLIITTTLQPVNNLARGVHSIPKSTWGTCLSGS